jgi:DNA-binding protein HU-beta
MADLNRQDIVRGMMAEVDGLNQKMAAASLEAAIAYISQALSQHQTITIQDFGKFGVRHRATRQGCHPATHLPLEIPATAIAYFSPSPQLKRLVNSYIQSEPSSNLP